MSATRRLLALTTASGLALTGLVVAGTATADAPAGPCPTYTDAAGDAAPGDPSLYPLFGEDDVDLLAVSLSVDAGVFTSALKVAALTDYGPEYAVGESVQSLLTVAGKAVVLKAVRDGSTTPATVTATMTVAGAASDAKVSAVYDLKASTITLGVAVADLEKAAGASLSGQPVTAMSATSSTWYPTPGASGFAYDTATAPKTATYSFGGSCSGAAPVSTSSPTPTPTPSATTPPPSDGLFAQPRKGCVQFKDAAGDATSNPVTGALGDPDDDLDLIAVNYKTTGSALQVFVKETALGTAPSSLGGFVYDTHSFATGFTVGGKAITLTAGASGPATATVAGAASTALHATATFDTKASNVVFSVPLADLATVTGAAVNGAAVTALTASSDAESSDGLPGGTADEAAPTTVAEKTYAVGDNTCFLPPAGKLYLDGLTGVYTDGAAVVASLQDADGADVAGAALTLAVPGQPTRSAVTNATGDAVFRFRVTSKAGASTAALTFTGTDTVGAAKLSAPFVVKAESTVLKAVASKGYVTATLTDNDRTPVAKRVIVFTVGSRTAKTVTNAKGQAVLKGLAKGTVVKVAFAAVPGYYTAAKSVTAKAL